MDASAYWSELEHHDSPDLEHWLDKQNHYTTAEAVTTYQAPMAAKPRLFGTTLQRRMWIKKHFMKIPFRICDPFLYHCLVQGAWRAGWVGYAWSRLRCDVIALGIQAAGDPHYRAASIETAHRSRAARSACPAILSGLVPRVHRVRVQQA